MNSVLRGENFFTGSARRKLAPISGISFGRNDATAAMKPNIRQVAIMKNVSPIMMEIIVPILPAR